MFGWRGWPLLRIELCSHGLRPDPHLGRLICFGRI
jgi:hypothetical protein